MKITIHSLSIAQEREWESNIQIKLKLKYESDFYYNFDFINISKLTLSLRKILRKYCHTKYALKHVDYYKINILKKKISKIHLFFQYFVFFFLGERDTKFSNDEIVGWKKLPQKRFSVIDSLTLTWTRVCTRSWTTNTCRVSRTQWDAMEH